MNIYVTHSPLHLGSGTKLWWPCYWKTKSPKPSDKYFTRCLWSVCYSVTLRYYRIPEPHCSY